MLNLILNMKEAKNYFAIGDYKTTMTFNKNKLIKKSKGC